MTVKAQLAAIGFAVLVGCSVGYLAHKQRVETITPPAKIVHDTVQVIDTVKLTKTITKLKPDTVWVDSIITSKPETVYRVPPLYGLTLLYSPKVPGDTGQAYGFGLQPLQDSAYSLNRWKVTWVSPGPLAALIVDSSGVRTSFYAPPPPPCTIKDRAKAGAYIAGGVELVRLLLGRP